MFEIITHRTNAVKGEWVLTVFRDGFVEFQVEVGPDSEWAEVVDQMMAQADEMGLLSNDVDRSELRYEATKTVVTVLREPPVKVHTSSADLKEIALARLAGVAQKFLHESPLFDKKLDKEGLWNLIESGVLSSRELGQAFGIAIKKEVFGRPEAE